ncbi:high-affinity nicotinic acid plasma membrane permease [Pyronema domesticum]|nr:high-affinity nicotinic acid plasma membrane permease [Pyronema domesticum]
MATTSSPGPGPIAPIPFETATATDVTKDGSDSENSASSLIPGEGEVAEEENAEVVLGRIYRKLDRRIIPPFWTLYFLCAAIRSNIGLSLTMNLSEKHSLPESLGLSSSQISLSLALFYITYILFDLPANLLMLSLPPHLCLSRIVILVGIIGSLHAALTAAWNFYLLRLLLGVVIAGMWPGMAYYISLFYPPQIAGRRIGMYFTAAQVSAAVGGLVSAGFQKMDGLGIGNGLEGWRWMVLVYGLLAVVDGIAILWWLPDRPDASTRPTTASKSFWARLEHFIPTSPPALVGREAEMHLAHLRKTRKGGSWSMLDVGKIMLDPTLYPMILMYLGVVGVGIGVQSFATIIIKSILPGLTSIQLSLLAAPIWICDLIAILLVTPLSDKYSRHRPVFFIVPALIQIAGLLLTTFAHNGWVRYAGLLVVGFGLGPTVPVTMALASEDFNRRHGEVGVAAATAVVSGLGNIGSVITTWGLYTGWKGDKERGYRGSNLVMCGMVGVSIVNAGWVWWRRMARLRREEGVVDGR